MPNMMAIMRSRVARAVFKSRAYKRALLDDKTGQLSENGRIIMAHLKRFSRYGKPPVYAGSVTKTDMFEVGRMVGRQETVQLIVEALHLDEKTLTNLQEEFIDE